MKGKFITFEGGDGVGKSTQVAKLYDFLCASGIPCIKTREPGGTEASEALRKFFLGDTKYQWNAVSELLLVMACRRDHIQNKISPALHDGICVICDRYIDSSIVYQGYCHGRDARWVLDMHKHAEIDLFPDITFILDSAASKAHASRIADRASCDRLDSKDIDFYNKVFEGYRKLSGIFKERCHIINVSEDQNITFERIMGCIKANKNVSTLLR